MLASPSLRPFLFLALTAVACGKSEGDSGGTDGVSGSELSAEDQAMAEALWAEIDGYDSWGQLDPWVGIQPSDDGTHGSHVQIWANGTAEATVTAAGGGDMADGAVLVKEGYSDDSGSSVQAVTVMKKVPGYDSANGDWFYARYSASGDITTAGASAAGSCAGCHSAGQDSVRAYTW